MKLTQVITRTSLGVFALFNLALTTSAIAEPIVVTRGPNGAAHIVKADKVPADAKILPNNTVSKKVSPSTKAGIGGAESKSTTQLIQRGPNGAFFPARK